MRLENGFVINDKNDLIEMIWQDYGKNYVEGDVSASFIVRQLKASEEKKAREVKREDPGKEWTEKRISLYCRLLSLRIANAEKSIASKQLSQLLAELIVSDGKAGKKMRTLAEKLETGVESAEELFGEKGGILDEYEDNLFSRVLWDFFNPFGHYKSDLSSGTGQDEDEFSSRAERKKRETGNEGYKDHISLLNAYLSFAGTGLGRSAFRPDDPDYQDRCRRLYEQLNGMEEREIARRVFIPLGFHPLNGSGLFVLGNAYLLPENMVSDDEEQIKKRNCSFAVINIEDHICNKEKTFYCKMEISAFADLKDAVKYLHENEMEFYRAMDEKCSRRGGAKTLLAYLPDDLKDFVAHDIETSLSSEDMEAIEKYKEKSAAKESGRAPAMDMRQKQAILKERREKRLGKGS